MPIASELPVDTSASAAQMADAMFGSGITVLNASYTGAKDASGIYSDGDTVASEITPSDTGVILSTGNAADVTNSSGDVNTSSRTTTRHGEAGDSDLTDLAGMQTYDAAVFEANFIPAGSTLTMQFVFSSEEYLEYVNKGFNDAVGVWVNGEQAELKLWKETGVRVLPGAYLAQGAPGQNPGGTYIRVALVAPAEDTRKALSTLRGCLY